MKKIKIILSIFFIIILFSNCNNEPYEEVPELSESAKVLSGIQQENTTLEEIRKDPYLSSILEKALKNIKQNQNYAKNPSSESNIELSNQVKKYSLKEYTSYTIPIINGFGSSYIFQNLVIEKDILRDAIYLVTYYPDENYKESIKKHLLPNDNIDFTGSKRIEYLYYKRKVNITDAQVNNSTKKGASEVAPTNPDIDEPITICVETYTPKNCTNGGNHSPGQSCDPGASSSGTSGWIVSVSCTTIPSPQPPDGPGGPPGGCGGCAEPGNNYNSSGYYFPGGYSPDWKPQYICVGMTNGACTQVIPYTPILTIPMTDPYSYYTTFFSHDQIDKLLRFEYAEVKADIDEYLQTHKNSTGGYDIETQILLNNVFDAVTTNPVGLGEIGSKIDVGASLRSPVNIDRTAIDNNTTEGKKFNDVYDQLIKSPKFQKLFENVFKTNKRFNANFEIGTVVGAQGSTEANPLNPINNKITIDRNFIKNSSKLAIAKTILHECIHAFLNIKYYDPNQGTNIPNISNEDLIPLINKEYNSFNGNQSQHDFIYNFMLPTMKDILSEIKDLLVSTPESEFLEGLSFHPVSQTEDVKFSWDDFYLNFSLAGLQESVFFKNEIATFVKDLQTGENEAIDIKNQIKLN